MYGGTDKFQSDPHYGAAVYDAHIVLGVVALRRGDRQTAVKEMRLAASAPASSTIQEGRAKSLLSRLTNYLLKAGERESVIDFLEKSAALMPHWKEQLLKDAQAVRRGIMPESYQLMFTAKTG